MKQLALLLALLMCQACNGPAFPDRDGAAYLRKQNMDEATIAAVVEGQRLPAPLYDRLATSENIHVRFLVARNANIPTALMRVLMRDQSSYVRSGLAKNTALSPDVLRVLWNDSTHTVIAGLATNPALEPRQLLVLHNTKHPGLVYFAMNPNCPPEIQLEIVQSSDELAKKWLRVTAEVNRGGSAAKRAREQREQSRGTLNL